jgi:hypothetical protein
LRLLKQLASQSWSLRQSWRLSVSFRKSPLLVN